MLLPVQEPLSHVLVYLGLMRKFDPQRGNGELLLDPPTLLTDLVRSYNTTLSSLLDEHAPPCTRAIVSRPSVPWFNEEIRSAKRQRRRSERKWKLSNLDADFQAFKTIKNKTTYIMNNARRQFYTEFVENNSHDQRKHFCATKKLLNKKSDTALLSYCDKTSLANDTGTYFIKKISDIRAELDNKPHQCPTILMTTLISLLRFSLSFQFLTLTL